MTVLGERPLGDGLLTTSDDDADAIETQALFKEAHERRKHRRRAAGIVLLVVLLVAVLVVVVVNTGGSPAKPQKTLASTQSNGITSAAMPSQMVVWAQNTPGSSMTIQVISSRSGRVIRTLATDVGLFQTVPQPAISKVGTVYYDQVAPGPSTPGPGAQPPVEQILSVPLSGGLSTFVADGHDPEVSPNGRLLAYLTWAQNPTTGGPEGIVVKDLFTGAVNTWQYTSNSEPAIGPYINTISWSPDSRSLVVAQEAFDNRSWHLTARRLWLSGPSRSLEALPQIPLPLCPPGAAWASLDAKRDMAWAGFLNSREGIGDCHYVGSTRQSDLTEPVVFDLATGHVVRMLPSISGLIGQGPGGGYLADPSGQHLLFVGSGLGAGGLYRWTLSDQPKGKPSHPIFVKNDVGSASWVPPKQ